MKNHQNAPKKSHHEKTCVANAHVEAATETKVAQTDTSAKSNKKH